MKDAALTQCPQCEGTVKRLFFPVGVIFKGSGWYVNDSRKPEKSGEDTERGKKTESDKSSETGAKSSDASEPTASTDKGADAKPAASDTTAAASGAEK